MNITEKIKARVLERKTRNRSRTNKLKLKNRKELQIEEAKIRLNLEHEYNFYFGIKYLINEYGNDRVMKWYWTPGYINHGMPDVDYEIHSLLFDDPIEYSHFEENVNRFKKLINIKSKIHTPLLLNHFIDYVYEITNNIIQKYPKLQNITELERFALFRYHTVGALNNISLSVSPELKKRWKINFELFGAFYNTDYEYCGLYPELEKRCRSDVFHFKLEPNMNILVNPPYTEEWIEMTCELVKHYLEQNMNTEIWLVVPVWNKSDRKKLRLKNYDDMPILDTMKLSPYLIHHEITNLPFYNGLEKKEIKLKDKVHVYHLSNVSQTV